IIYRFQPHAAGEGIPSYIRGMRIHRGNLLFSVTFFKYWAALATLSTFGNGGVVGPLGRVSAGVMSFIGGKLNGFNIGFNRNDQHTAAICGLAAAVGAIFHTPLGGGIFAIEIIQRDKMAYKDLFPAILSSATAVFVCKAIGWDSFYQFTIIGEFMSFSKIGWLLLLSVLTGLAGGFYTYLYSFVTKVIKRKEGNVFVKVIAGSIVASFIAWAVNPELLGVSKNMITAVLAGDLPILTGRFGFISSISFILVVMLFCKLLCNCVTVGSGMSAGFTGPAAIAGMLLGSALACYLNIEFSSPTYYAFLAAGFSGMLASSMNVPLAAAVMTTEIFGLQYSFPAGLAAVIGFQIMRHSTIYDYALAGAGLTLDK
ncbi:MAG TPA: chloride channel protein, partial [bacterium]|nr:chloride channel protein [bacterium]